jgi:hypothetical protein
MHESNARTRILPHNFSGKARQCYVRFGSKQTFAVQNVISALPPKADMCSATRYVRFVPIRQLTRGPDWTKVQLRGSAALLIRLLAETKQLPQWETN